MHEGALAPLLDVPLTSILIALAALGVPVLMFEMGYGHYRGNYYRWPMYIPVVLPPIFAATAFLLLGTGAAWAYWTFAAASIALTLMGALGAFFHLQGVSRRTGGFNLDNLMVGPPLLAPLSFSILGVLGLLGLAYWGT